MKVNFAICGAQKAGTRALRHFLEQHPEIGFPIKPETHYFNELCQKDAPGRYDVYHAQFSEEALSKCTGDVTPIYIYWRAAHRRMRAYNPEMKLIVILRDPVERAFSQWAMQRRKKQEAGGFLATLLMEPLRYLWRGQDKVYSHVARGFYARQLRRLYRVFPPEQVLVLRNEALRDAHDETLRRVYRFLGVSEIEPPLSEKVHMQTYAEMPRLARALLGWVYRRDIRRLEKMTGWDLSDWG